MFEGALKAMLLQLEGDGFRAEAQRRVTSRTTDITVSYRPRTVNYVRTSVSDMELEDLPRNADTLLRIIEQSAAQLRGQAVVDALRPNRDVRFPSALTAEQASGLVAGMLSAIEHGKGIDVETAEILGRRLVHIVTKHCRTDLCERLALELMSHVERIGR